MRTHSAQAKRWSWILVDCGAAGFSSSILTAIFPIYLPTLVPKTGVDFMIAGFPIHTTALSLWSYTVSLSVLITFLISPVLGAWADASGFRKLLLGAFTALGVIATCALGFAHTWQTALIFFVFANMGYAGSGVFYNALLPAAGPRATWHKLSLEGFAWGYTAGAVSLAINLLILMKSGWFGISDKQLALQIAFIFAALWWLAFTIPALFILDEVKVLKSDRKPVSQHLTVLWRTLKGVPAVPSMALFLIAYAFFNDGVTTVISMSSLFGKEVLNLKEETLIATLLLAQFLGLPMTLAMSGLQKRFGPKRILMASLCFWCLLIGFAYQMQFAWEFILLGALVSVVQGVSQALPRSIFAMLIPSGQEGEFFSLFALSGKMTAFMGPLLFGVIKDSTGSARYSILSIGLLFFIGMVLLHFVSVPRDDKVKA